MPKFLNLIGSTESATSGSTVVSPMPGICDKILVKAGDHVKAKQPLAVIIAMKMEYVLKAPKDGIVKSVNGTVGKSVTKEEVIIAFEEEEDEKEEEQPKN